MANRRPALGIVEPPPHGLYTNCSNILYASHLDPRQVQVVLFKDSDSGRENPGLVELPSSPQAPTGCNKAIPVQGTDEDACVLIYWVGEIARRIVHDKLGNGHDGEMPGYFPNTKMMFVHSRIYGGYANPDIVGDQVQKLNPEPFAYESGLAMKWLIQSQIDETQQRPHLNAAGSLEYLSAQPHAPWIDWGPYLWAGQDLTYGYHQYPAPCAHCEIAGLTWRQDVLGTQFGCDPANSSQECDFEKLDNTHPGQCGRYKVAWMLRHFYCGKSANSNANYTKWLWGPTQGNVATCTQQEPLPPLNNGCGNFGQGPE